jgi:hypothetical protein
MTSDGSVGHKRWAIADGYIPGDSTSNDPRFVSHEAACILNAGDRDAHIAMTIYFHDRDPAGPYKFKVSARRTLHLRLNDLQDPETVPRETSYSALLESSEPVVVQHTRLDSRAPHLALLSTVAFAQG